jgi:hypothetical protein
MMESSEWKGGIEMPYVHDVNSMKASLEQNLVNPDTMELIPDLRVVWIDQANFNPSTMDVVACPVYRCTTNIGGVAQ